MRLMGQFFAAVEVFLCLFVTGLVSFYQMLILVLSCLLRREFPLSKGWKIGKGKENRSAAGALSTVF